MLKSSRLLCDHWCVNRIIILILINLDTNLDVIYISMNENSGFFAKLWSRILKFLSINCVCAPRNCKYIIETNTSDIRLHDLNFHDEAWERRRRNLYVCHLRYVNARESNFDYRLTWSSIVQSKEIAFTHCYE